MEFTDAVEDLKIKLNEWLKDLEKCFVNKAANRRCRVRTTKLRNFFKTFKKLSYQYHLTRPTKKRKHGN